MPFRKGAHPDLKRSEKADPEFCCSMSARESASAGIKRAWVISVAPANGKPAAAGRWNSPAPIPYLESWSGIIRQATRIALLRMQQAQGDGSTASTSAISRRRTKSAIGPENETSQSCSRYRQASRLQSTEQGSRIASAAHGGLLRWTALSPRSAAIGAVLEFRSLNGKNVRENCSAPIECRNLPRRKLTQEVEPLSIRFRRSRILASASVVPSWNEPKNLSHGISSDP